MGGASRNDTRAIVVMGVTGCGKSSVALTLCQRIPARMIEGDACHPAQNIRKMKAGIPLTDADRQGWLDSLGQELARAARAGDTVVLACSALKRRYRDTLRASAPSLGFVFLQLSPAAAIQRVTARTGHFMPASLVDSQFRDLEPPIDEPGVLTLDATGPLSALIEQIVAWWHPPAAVTQGAR